MNEISSVLLEEFFFLKRVIALLVSRFVVDALFSLVEFELRIVNFMTSTTISMVVKRRVQTAQSIVLRAELHLVDFLFKFNKNKQEKFS